jgi:hypothetical protein
VAEYDEPSARPQCAKGAKRQRAPEPIERNIHAVAGQLTHPGQEVLVAVVDRNRAEPFDRGAVASCCRPVEAKPCENEAHDLRRVVVLGHLDRVRLQHADLLRVTTPDGQRADAVSVPQARTARADFLDHPDELVPGRERRLRHAEIGARPQLGIGE